ncbi:mis-match repair protein, putative [Leishmania donovani]|uniref:Mis-match repair protein, putative n=2 Tax=Leishmania donovani TaxID=5661 RepID=E9BF96_LEIDO|nr:mis-match repair protein, putative [Leishmania donovani]CBZ33922.1 mis-match repair protein, putative [Leishmania donovani]
MFTSPTAWNELYGPPRAPALPPEAASRRHSRVFAAATTAPVVTAPPHTLADGRVSGPFSGHAYHRAVPPPVHALFATPTTSGFCPASSHYTVASQPVRYFPLLPTPAAERTYYESHPYTSAYSGDGGGWPHAENAPTDENNYELAGPSRATAPWRHGTCGPHQLLQSQLRVSGTMGPGAAGGVFGAGAAAAPYAMHKAHSAEMAADAEEAAWEGGAAMPHDSGMPGARRPLRRPPPSTHGNPMSDCRGATLWPVAQSVSPVERGEAAKAAAQDGSRLHHAAYASREGRRQAAVGMKLAAHTPHDVDGRYTDGQLLAPPPPRPPSPLHEHSDHEQQQQTHEYSSISDGARHLNSAGHRSAASAAALFFHSPSVTGGFASSPCASGSAALRAGRRAAAATSAISSTATFPSATGASKMVTPAASAAAAQAEPCCVAALIFNNAKEVGVALCELPSLTVSLFQYGDTATFFKTASLLHTRNPVEVLVPSTAVDSELVQTVLRQHGAHMTFTSVQRCFYNAEEGVQRLSQLKSSAEASLCIEDTDRYLCVAAANAVVLYMEHVNDMHLLPGSVRVRAEALEHYMEVSRTTARVLQIIPDTACVSAAAAASMELMRNAANDSERADRQQRVRAQRYGAARRPMFLGHDLAEPPPLQTVALVDAIPRACTVMGQRYLRRTLLQPLRDRVAVQGRHDAVEWLLCEPRRLHMLRVLLRHTAALDLERLTATLTHQPRRERSSAQQQSYLESLQLLWSALPHLEQLRVQLKAYLGPLPRVQAPVNGEGVPPSTPSPLPGGGSDAAAPSHDLRSTAAHPSVLHSIATALGQCRFPELETLMGTYLERSVLPSVVGHHERSAAHYGALHSADTGSTHIPPSVSVVAQQQQPQRPRRRLRSDDGDALASHQHPQERSQRVTGVFLRLLRMCFLVQAPHSGELDALRTRLSLRISDITSYAAELRATYRIFSLRLEPDPVKLYCLSYAVAEEAKAQAGPFTWRYAGGSHFALYLSALREQQLRRQQEQQQGQGRTLRSSPWHPPTSAGDPFCTASSSPPTELSRHTSDADGAGFESSVIDPFSPFTFGANHTAPRQLRRRRVRCSTEDLDYRCARAQECVAAILQLQLHSVQPLVRAIQHEFLGSLQATVESVALLDTLLCFALYSLTHQCTRPVLVELPTGSTTAPRVRTLMTELPGDGEAVASSGRRATSVAGGAGASWDRVDEYTDAASAAADLGGQGGGTAASAGTSATSSDAATPSCTPPLSTLTAHTMTSAATTETETRHASEVRLFLDSALHPSAAQWQPPSRAVARAGLSARWTGAEVGGKARPASGSSGGLTMSWGSGGGDVCVVTGPNACGKTTLLRILGQYFTLAQAGCFVPAQHAQLFLADRLLAHMLCDELPSITHSSFRRELMELSELTHAATAESVALIDELGRSTTTAQGFSLAWATALLLSDRRVHSVLTTHYPGLPSLARVRPARVVAFHFRVTFQHLAARDGGRDGVADSSWRGPARTRITIARFGHTLFPGPCPQRWYGLALAEKLHFFEPVLAMARRTRTCQSPAEAHTEENEV